MRGAARKGGPYRHPNPGDRPLHLLVGQDPPVGDSFDNALAESAIGLFKTELHRNPAALAANGGPWQGLDDLEIATCAWVSWFNERRLHGELHDATPAEVEAAYYRDHPLAPAA